MAPPRFSAGTSFGAGGCGILSLSPTGVLDNDGTGINGRGRVQEWRPSARFAPSHCRTALLWLTEATNSSMRAAGPRRQRSQQSPVRHPPHQSTKLRPVPPRSRYRPCSLPGHGPVPPLHCSRSGPSRSRSRDHPVDRDRHANALPLSPMRLGRDRGAAANCRAAGTADWAGPAARELTRARRLRPGAGFHESRTAEAVTTPGDLSPTPCQSEGRSK